MSEVIGRNHGTLNRTKRLIHTDSELNYLGRNNIVARQAGKTEYQPLTDRSELIWLRVRKQVTRADRRRIGRYRRVVPDSYRRQRACQLPSF
jgi:hypothetical protein